VRRLPRVSDELLNASPFVWRAIRRLKRELARGELLLREFEPQPPRPLGNAPTVQAPSVPVVDVHNHLSGNYAGRWRTRPVAEVIAQFASVGVRFVVDLDGGWGARLERLIQHYPPEILVFAGVDYDSFSDSPRFGEVEARRLMRSVAAGARGLKVWKTLGLRARDGTGRLVPVDDRRLDPLWEAAADRRVPVLIHVADPPAFFAPFDARNERWEELRAEPGDRLFEQGWTYDDYLRLLEQFEAVVDRHRDTTFIGAHVAGRAEDLPAVGRLLDRYPNLMIDVGGRLAELGRQPYTARDFLVNYAHRVLFGTDAAADVAIHSLYYTFLETRAEYFSYFTSEPPPQGRWRIYGVGLDDATLRKIYYENAAALFGLPPLAQLDHRGERQSVDGSATNAVQRGHHDKALDPEGEHQSNAQADDASNEGTGGGEPNLQ